jgi:WD40 repeat protein
MDDGTLVVVRSNGLSFVSFPALQELSFLSLGEAHGIEAPEDAGCRSAALSERPDILPNLRLLFVGCNGSIEVVRLPPRTFPTNSYDSAPFLTSDPAHLSFSSDHKYMAAMAQVGDAIKVYEEGTEAFRTNRPSPTGFGTPSFAFQPDAVVLAAGLQDGSTAMWHLNKGLSALRWPRQSRVTSLSFSPDQKWLATVTSGDGILEIISTSDVTNGKSRYAFQIGKDLTKPIFSPDSRFLLVASKQSIHLLQTSPWKRLTPHEKAGDYFQAGFSPDSQMLVAADANGIHRFETATWQEKPIIKGRFPSGFRFSPDGRWLAASVDNRSTRAGSVVVHVWSLATGEEPSGSRALVTDAERWAPAHKMYSHGEGVSPDGRWKLGPGKRSSSMELTQVGAGAVGLLFHDASINDADFSVDGRWLVISTADDAVHVWPLLVPDLITEACKLLPRNLTREEWKEFGMEGDYRKTCPDLADPSVDAVRIPSTKGNTAGFDSH